MMYTELIQLYDKIAREDKTILPLCACSVTTDISVVLSKDGQLISVDRSREKHFIPATAQSMSRTRAVAPHPLLDNLTYLSIYGNNEIRYKAYMKKLKIWADRDDSPLFVKAVYSYLSENDIVLDLTLALHDFAYLKDNKKVISILVLDAEDERTVLQNWASYYLPTLQKTGHCAITQEDDFIPDAYQSKIIADNSKAKLFMANSSSPFFIDNVQVGFIASQKIANVLAFFCRKNGLLFDNGNSCITYYRQDDYILVVILQSVVVGRMTVSHYKKYKNISGVMAAISFIRHCKDSSQAVHLFQQMLHSL